MLKYQNDIYKSQTIGFVIAGVLCFSLMKNIGTIFLISISSSYIKFRNFMHKIMNVNKKSKRKRPKGHKRLQKLLKVQDQNTNIVMHKTNYKSKMHIKSPSNCNRNNKKIQNFMDSRPAKTNIRPSLAKLTPISGLQKRSDWKVSFYYNPIIILI